MRRIVVLLVLSLAIWSCSESYEDQINAFQKFIAGKRIGDSSDVWLVKRNFGIDDRVALIFGYISDIAACEEIAAALMQVYPQNSYACVFAN